MAQRAVTSPGSATQPPSPPAATPTVERELESLVEVSPEEETLGMPGFGPSRGQRIPPRDDLAGHPATEIPGGGPGGPDAPASDPEASSPGTGRAGAGPATAVGPSRASTKAIAEGIVPFIAALAGMLTTFVHERRTPHPDGNEVWIASDDELEAFSLPLARIIARRAPAGLAADSDISDALTSGIVATGYTVRNLHDEQRLARTLPSYPMPAADQPDVAPAAPGRGAPPVAGGGSVVDMLSRQAPGMSPT